MSFSRAGYGLIGLFALIFIMVTVLVASETSHFNNLLGLFVRFAALYGFLMMAIAAIMTSFIVPIARAFGRTFIRIHHMFALLGIVLLTLHPITYALSIGTPIVFLPSYQSWIDFWANGGRVALILVYIAAIAGLLRIRWKQWRYAHALIYGALLFGIVHANLVGTDFTNSGVLLIYNGIFGVVVFVFILNLGKKWRSRNRGPVSSI